MSNLPKMSARATEALEVLSNGGEFRYALERNNYTGREQFQWRLKNSSGVTIKGISGAAYRELCKLGFGFSFHPSGFTGSCSSYRLKVDA